MNPKVYNVDTDRGLLEFARELVRGRSAGFKKDLDICLTANDKGSHAYFPGLMSCISFLDFLSGLYAGKVQHHGYKEFMAYTERFLPTSKYRCDDLAILYEGFRHKIAHLGHPYTVFHTSTSSRLGLGNRAITWIVYASHRKQALELVPYTRPRQVKKSITPWPVYYDHKMKISVASLAADARRSIRGPSGYIECMKREAQLRANFKRCMEDIYPK